MVTERESVTLRAIPGTREATGVFGVCVGASFTISGPTHHPAEKPEAQVTTGLPAYDPAGARTQDLLIKSQLLFQLSYRVALS